MFKVFPNVCYLFPQYLRAGTMSKSLCKFKAEGQEFATFWRHCSCLKGLEMVTNSQPLVSNLVKIISLWPRTCTTFSHQSVPALKNWETSNSHLEKLFSWEFQTIIATKYYFFQGNLLKGVDKKTGIKEGIEPIKRVFTYVLFSGTHFL